MASMMAVIALLGVLSWIIAGLIQHGMKWFRYPPLYLVVTFPILFSSAVTFAVAFFQGRVERGRHEHNGTAGAASQGRDAEESVRREPGN
jgi:cytochrome c biogenesis protein CcdA